MIVTKKSLKLREKIFFLNDQVNNDNGKISTEYKQSSFQKSKKNL